MPDALENEIKTIVAEILEITPEEVQLEGEINQIYEIDSVAMLEILVTLERRYQIEIQEQEIKTITRIPQLIALIRRKISEKK